MRIRSAGFPMMAAIPPAVREQIPFSKRDRELPPFFAFHCS